MFILGSTEARRNKNFYSTKRGQEGFPGGSVVKNPPANARDMGLILDPGDPTCCRAAKPMHHNYWACALEPGSHNHWSPHTLEPELRNKRSQCNEKS